MQPVADAVYFGLQHFSARAKVGFEVAELNDVVRYAHRNAVKCFVTFNTLVFDHEMQLAVDAIKSIADAGCDAIIVQDIGIARIARQLAPNLALHGSTQMSITSAEGVEFASSLGCNRVVLGRELSLADIRRIANSTSVELEVFVHGALCVSYSGQCFSSEAWGGRSANRGQCAQACRLSYDLIVDGEHRDLGEYRYLLSPGDLYALEQVPELCDIGISCFKIEGRYKGPEYVALTTRAYREAIDDWFDKSEEREPVKQDGSRDQTRNDLEQIYSRGLGSHFIAGVNHQSVVGGRFPRHRGLMVGTVTLVESYSVIVDSTHEILPGDGLVFDSARWRSPDEPEEGGNVFEVEHLSPDRVRLKFGVDAISFARIRSGDLVFRSNSPTLNKTAARLIKTSRRTTGICFRIEAEPEKPLRVRAQTSRGETVSFESVERLSHAQSKPLSNDLIQQQLARLGGTPFHLSSVEWKPGHPVFCPVSLLNQARRYLVDQLVKNREQSRGIETKSVTLQFDSVEPGKNCPDPCLHILVRNSDQLEAALALQPASITLDYLELYGLRPSINRIKERQIVPRVASPRILKPSEQKVVRFLLSLDCQILIRSSGLLIDLIRNFADRSGGLPELHGDFSLNAANSNSFHSYLDMGLRRITPAYDLNSDQINSLTNSVDPQHMETVIFHHLPVFHTEHCVFCRFLSDGTDNTNCGHPCEKHKLSVRDASGRQHAVLADVGCRNTVFNAESQVATSQLGAWKNSGIAHFRIEFVHQTREQVLQIGTLFRDFLSGNVDVKELDHQLKGLVPQGTTEGSLFVPKNYKDLVQLS